MINPSLNLVPGKKKIFSIIESVYFILPEQENDVTQPVSFLYRGFQRNLKPNSMPERLISGTW